MAQQLFPNIPILGGRNQLFPQAPFVGQGNRSNQSTTSTQGDDPLIPLDEFLEQVLEEDPGLTFFSFQDQFGGSQNQQNFFQTGQGFDIAYNQFLGELGLALGGGGAGGLIDPNNVDLGNLPTFNQFLGQENFFGDLFQSQSRTTRGLFDANFAANPRVLFNLGG